MTQLSGKTWLFFGLWFMVGLVVYFAYSRGSSAVGHRRAEA
jgi:hypothetical protein